MTKLEKYINEFWLAEMKKRYHETQPKYVFLAEYATTAKTCDTLFGKHQKKRSLEHIKKFGEDCPWIRDWIKTDRWIYPEEYLYWKDIWEIREMWHIPLPK